MAVREGKGGNLLSVHGASGSIAASPKHHNEFPMKKLAFILMAVVTATVAFAQAAIVLFVLVSAAAAGGIALYVIDRGSDTLSMRWVILEMRRGHTFCAIQTNYVPVTPHKTDALPAFFVVTCTNGPSTNEPHLFRVRLAEDWEIPQGFVPSEANGVKPVIYSKNDPRIQPYLNP